MKWQMLQMFSNFMLVVSCEPHSLHLQADNRTVKMISCLYCLLQCFFFFSSFYQFSLYSSGHQIFMCVFELFYVAEKCLMLLYAGNKSSVVREQTLSRPGITRPLFFWLLYWLHMTWISSLFLSLFISDLRRAATLPLDNVKKTVTLSDKGGLLEIID